jgi:hypothetical protein
MAGDRHLGHGWGGWLGPAERDGEESLSAEYEGPGVDRQPISRAMSAERESPMPDDENLVVDVDEFLDMQRLTPGSPVPGWVRMRQEGGWRSGFGVPLARGRAHVSPLLCTRDSIRLD